MSSLNSKRKKAKRSTGASTNWTTSIRIHAAAEMPRITSKCFPEKRTARKGRSWAGGAWTNEASLFVPGNCVAGSRQIPLRMGRSLLFKLPKGVVFTGDCQQGRFTRRPTRCPNCDAAVQEPSGTDAYLICPTLQPSPRTLAVDDRGGIDEHRRRHADFRRVFGRAHAVGSKWRASG